MEQKRITHYKLKIPVLVESIISCKTGKEKNIYRQKLVNLFSQAVEEERKSDFPEQEFLITSLCVHYLGFYISRQIPGIRPSSIIDSYNKERGEKAVSFFSSQVLYQQAEKENCEAINLLMAIGVNFSGNISKQVLDFLVELGKKEGLHHLVLWIIEKKISSHEKLLAVLAQISKEAAYKRIIKWFKQKDNDRKILALKQLISMENCFCKRQYKEVLNLLKGFWQDSILSTDTYSAISYYILIGQAYAAGAIKKEKAIGRLTAVFSQRGYLYPDEHDSFKMVLWQIDPDQAGDIYAQGFLTAAKLESRYNFPSRYDEGEFKTIIGDMKKKEKKVFFEDLVVNTTDNILLWNTSAGLLEIVSKNEAEIIFRQAFATHNSKGAGTISELLFRIINGYIDRYKHLKRKSVFFPKLLEELYKNNNPEIIFEVARMASKYGGEKDLIRLVPVLKGLFNNKKIELAALIKVLLNATARTKKKKSRKMFFDLLEDLYQKKKRRVLDALALAVKEDWQGTGSTALSFLAMEFIGYIDDDNCLSLAIKIVKYMGKEKDSINSGCVEFLAKKAIAGNKKALNAVIVIPESKISSPVSEFLVDIFKKCKSKKIRGKAAAFIINRFNLALSGKRNDLYAHLEIKNMRKIRKNILIQQGFLACIESGFEKEYRGKDFYNAISEISNFVTTPEFKEKARQIVRQGVVKAEEKLKSVPWDEKKSIKTLHKIIFLGIEQLRELDNIA